MMNNLTIDQFQDFYHALYGYHPFPWQNQLAEKVCRCDNPESVWPQAMSLPTSSGKTACIDIAIFALAFQADWGYQRAAPRRIFFVVDRRVIVDEAYERSCAIADQLKNAGDGILKIVADRLRLLCLDAEQPPLRCHQLRGGIYREETWASDPLQPAVIASTVDQIGSRILFRGYGCSQNIAPIHAGFVSNDALIILDEAHCSQPFMQTLRSVARYRSWKADNAREGIYAPFYSVVLSATPPEELEAEAFRLSEKDHKHEFLKQRIQAKKIATLVESSKKSFVDDCVEKAVKLVSEGFQRVAVMVNRVNTAKQIHDHLNDSKAIKKVVKKLDSNCGLDMHSFDTGLFIGRMRPIDRDDIAAKWLKLLNASNYTETPIEKPVIIVATQCLEVGANLDFDALVTECASLDALRQRFGRVNRRGQPKPASAYILLKENKPDAIYGDALQATWNWLKDNARDNQIDMGIAALDTLLEKQPEMRRMLSAPAKNAPVLLPAHLDCFVQTNPYPEPSPDVSLFLHGPESGPADVQVCWRADIPKLIEGTKEEQDLATQKIIGLLCECQPLSSECMPVPIGVIKQWLSCREDESKGHSIDEAIVDVEGFDLEAKQELTNAWDTTARWVVCWKGPDESSIVKKPKDIYPGDTLIIPEDLKGWERFGYIPTSNQDNPSEEEQHGETIDLFERANAIQRRKRILRLHPHLIQNLVDEPIRSELLSWIDIHEEDDVRDAQENLISLANELIYDLEPGSRNEQICRILAEKKTTLVKHPLKGFILKDKRKKSRECIWNFLSLISKSEKRFDKNSSEDTDGFTSEDDSSVILASSAPVSLKTHTENVVQEARHMAEAIGCSSKMKQNFEIAARYHDCGKSDIRFQAMLHNGNRMAALAANEPLAKSSNLSQQKWENVLAHKRSGLPSGFRHELLSVRLAESSSVLKQEGIDVDLILHLIASHHGRCRPFAPVVFDEHPEEISLQWNNEVISHSSATGLERLDSGIAERFWNLVECYGWWGEAYIESLFRLADHLASAREEHEEKTSEQSSEVA